MQNTLKQIVSIDACLAGGDTLSIKLPWTYVLDL